MYPVVYTQLLSCLTVSELLHSTARVNPDKLGQREKFGQNIVNAFYVTLNLAPGLQRLQRFDSSVLLAGLTRVTPIDKLSNKHRNAIGHETKHDIT